MDQGSVTAGSAPASIERRHSMWESIVASLEEGDLQWNLRILLMSLLKEPPSPLSSSWRQREEDLGSRELLNTRERARFCWRTSQVSSLSQICQAVLCISGFAGGSGPAFLSFPARTALPAQATAGFSLISVHQ